MSKNIHSSRFDVNEWIVRHKVLTIIISIIIAILAIKTMLVVFPANQPSTSEAAANQQVSVSESEISPTLTPTPSIPHGLQITRDDFISGIQKLDSNLQFTQGLSIKGQDNYTAREGQNIMQLIGSEDNLTEISSTALLDNSGNGMSGNFGALVYVLGVASVVDGDSKDWITSAMTDISNAWANGETSVKRSQVINGKKFQLEAEQTQFYNSVILTIDSAN